MEATRSSSDIISSLPKNIIENILCLVPIQDAVRTSILAREWRYNWAKIPKLVFNEKDMLIEKHQLRHIGSCFEGRYVKNKELPRYGLKMCNLFLYAIQQVLLLHNGSILEFTLSINWDNAGSEIDQIILHLSRKNTVKKFTLDANSDAYSIPSSFFSLYQLTDIYLQNCNFYPKPTFSGFRSLTSLYLKNVNITLKMLLCILSNSPLLKSMSVVSYYCTTLISVSDHDVSFYELFKFLPVIEHLSLDMWVIPFEEVPQELPTALVHLRYLCLQKVCIFEKGDLSFLILLIRSSPNLEKLKLKMYGRYDQKSETDSVTLQDYSDILLEHLNELEIKNFVNLKPVLEFVKLAWSRHLVKEGEDISSQ